MQITVQEAEKDFFLPSVAQALKSRASAIGMPNPPAAPYVKLSQRAFEEITGLKVSAGAAKSYAAWIEATGKEPYIAQRIHEQEPSVYLDLATIDKERAATPEMAEARQILRRHPGDSEVIVEDAGEANRILKNAFESYPFFLSFSGDIGQLVLSREGLMRTAGVAAETVVSEPGKAEKMKEQGIEKYANSLTDR